jgi:uncharacterized protein YjaZ
VKPLFRAIALALLFMSIGEGRALARDVDGSKPVKIASRQNATIIDTNEYLQKYIDAARNKPADERAALYAKYFYEPVVKKCGEGGEYYEYGKYNLIRPITNLDALAKEIAIMRRADLANMIASALSRSAKLLPGPDTTVCVLAADPDSGYIRTDLHGVSGYTFGAGKILLQVATLGDWRQWVPYTVAHEYHHSTWTWQRHGKPVDWTLLHSIIFEGKADAFAHSVFPKQTAPWVSTLTSCQEAAVWPRMKAELATTDYRVNQKFLFGREDVPKLAGYTIGFHVVSDYLKNHPTATIADWTALDEQQLFNDSGYAPPKNWRAPAHSSCRQ